MPKILVADDNSNIQKMVALALKDQGIEVTAVGNGEAAVRRLPDVLPDIVLADVFMPVRSGYEVCEYVKKDPRFSGIPVVLLIGAFDPLDESEAKRVGADGVLKKPFVPPEPLLTMIKGLLERNSSDGLVTIPVVNENESRGEESHSTPKTAPSPTPYEDEGEAQEFPALGREALDTIAGQSTGLASLNRVEPEEAEEAPVTTSQRDAALGEPAFWHPLPPEKDPAEGEEPESTASSWGDSSGSLPRRDEFEGVQALEADETKAEVRHAETDSLQTEPETLHIEPGKAPGLAESADEWLQEELAHPTAHPEPELEPSSGEAPGQESSEPSPLENLIQFSSPAANHEEPTSPSTLRPVEEPITPTPEYAGSPVADDLLAPEAGEPWTEPDTADEVLEGLGATKTREAPPPLPQQMQPAPPAGKQTPSPELVETVVSRVMEKLQPQVIEIVTREVLRPIVEALVRREVNKS